MSKSRGLKRKILKDLNHNKFNLIDFSAKFKYHFSPEIREYLLIKSGKVNFEVVYNNPLPKLVQEISANKAIQVPDTNLFYELKWYFECVLKFHDEISAFLKIAENIENNILENDLESSFKHINNLNSNVCFSVYGLQSEFFINELNGTKERNIEIIKSIPFKPNLTKLIVLLDLSRLRIDTSISTWQYDSTINENIKQYKDGFEKFGNYIKYKSDPTRYEHKLLDSDFITFFDSDLSIIDRYITLKRVLSEQYFEYDFNEDEQNVLVRFIDSCSNIFQDSFWNKFKNLIGIDYNIQKDLLMSQYNNVQEYYFNGDYKSVINECELILNNNPGFSDIYLFYIKSLKFENKIISLRYKEETLIFRLLNLLSKIISKEDNYNANREKLLELYYSISHFTFSNVILEFIFNEFKLNIPESVKYITFLESKVFRYNGYNLLKDVEQLYDVNSSNCIYNYLQVLNIKYIDLNVKDFSFFKFKITIGFLIKKEKYNKAIEYLNEFNNTNKISIDEFAFVRTWFLKTSIKCYFKIENYDELSKLIVNSYIRDNFAYDHFFDELFVNTFLSQEEDNYTGEISIPILFEIYKEPQTVIYDRIANFLIFHNVRKPSQILELEHLFDSNKFIYFLEKVCIKENIQDSPFLNSIESLEAERIKILNYLKFINHPKIKIYNQEILDITKSASLRKGLMQIHESRIYVDTNNIYKLLSIELPDVFERYLELVDINYLSITTAKLNEDYIENNVVVTFYLLEPVDENEINKINLKSDKNVITVPMIRFKYFLSLFESIRHEYIYNEAYGFRSFLSMRIRHGTFSNVLRSVFDKYRLVSTKDSNSDEYKDILFWNTRLNLNKKSLSSIQTLLKEFSRSIDALIENALSWVNIKNSMTDNYMHYFDFNFTRDQMYLIYFNEMGKIDDFDQFMSKTFDILNERLELCLDFLRQKISNELSATFQNILENLQKDINEIPESNISLNPITQDIIRCKTDIQAIIIQMTKWFNISTNQYVEEFTIDMILQNSLDYINSIYTNTINNATVETKINCKKKFKGEYFESFGDIFINIIENAVSKNRDLGSSLFLNIEIKENNNMLDLKITNNISESIDEKLIRTKIKGIIQNVQTYKNESMDSSFEEGSGYLKICKCISKDLERENYLVEPKLIGKKFEVRINFNLNKLVV